MQRGARHHHHQHLRQTVAEGKRQHIEDAIVLCQTEIGTDRDAGRTEARMGVHHALRRAGGAGRVEDQRQPRRNLRRC